MGFVRFRKAWQGELQPNIHDRMMMNKLRNQATKKIFQLVAEYQDTSEEGLTADRTF